MLEALQWIADWFAALNSDQGVFASAMTWVIKKALLLWLEFQLESFQFAWGIARGLLTDLGVFSLIAAKFSALPPEALATLNFFKIPHGINILLSAWTTKFVMRMVPGI